MVNSRPAHYEKMVKTVAVKLLDWCAVGVAYGSQYIRLSWVTSSVTLPLYGGGFTSADVGTRNRGRLRELLRRCRRLGYLAGSTASVQTLTSVCSPASPATADIYCTLFFHRNSNNATFYVNVYTATSFRCTHSVSMTVTFSQECYIKILIDLTVFVDIRFISIYLHARRTIPHRFITCFMSTISAPLS